MNVWPLRFREAKHGKLVFADDSGGFFRSDTSFLERYAEGDLLPADETFLEENGHAFRHHSDLSYMAFAYRWAARQAVRRRLNYVILVPTLRCNLSCGYCQVSRAAETARGFDWTDEVTDGVLRFLDGLDTTEIKVEFQGGEPLLRLDLLDRVRSFCRALTVHRLVANGAGLGLMSGYICAPQIEAGRLVHLLPDWSPPAVEVSLVFPSRRELSPVVRAFVDYMKEVSRPGMLWMNDPLAG